MTETSETEIYMKPLGGYQITIKRGTFSGWIGLVYGCEFEHRKRVQAQTREEVKKAISKIIDLDLYWL